jgi:uncharacterized membrane protein
LGFYIPKRVSIQSGGREIEPLSQEYIDSCRQEQGRILRGDNMTRIETFVDAAFAFTMLVISIDEIPSSPVELFELSKDIPAFILSALIIGSIWLSHSSWSRTFGLQDKTTIYLSLGLVMLVLVFVYPIKLMMQATVLYMSINIFDTQVLNTGLFENRGWQDNDVAGLFLYVGLGVISLSMILAGFYRNALRYRHQLRLTTFEVFYCKEMLLSWTVVAATAILSIVVASISSQEEIARAGFVYFSLFFSIPVAVAILKRKSSPGE